MVGTFSPHSDVGGTLHFPSPTHLHHVDPTSALRQLRRSLSRSPSKVPTFRLVTANSTSPSPCSPLSPSREAMSQHSLSTCVDAPKASAAPPTLAIQIQNSTRKTRPSSRILSSSTKPARQNSNGQRSPRKRTLQETSNAGNSTPGSSAKPSGDQENWLAEPSRDLRPDATSNAPISAEYQTSSNSPYPPPRATARFERGYNSWGAKSSPLKRSDGGLAFDPGSRGSPSAKRRSLHGGIFSPDFNIFDHAVALQGHADTDMTDEGTESEHMMSKDPPSPVPNRTCTLRRTTLQQRHEKPLLGRFRPIADPNLEHATPNFLGAKSKARMSLDAVLPAMPRESPFSSQGALPNASSHPMPATGSKGSGSNASFLSQRHPLSRTISQSTSTSSMAEDSPTHIPIRHPESRKSLFEFSKSMPVGSTQPAMHDGMSPGYPSTEKSFATPENYKLVKPLPAAFMSTGLISKRTKDLEDSSLNLGASTSTMPDTPCKRHSLAEMPSPQPVAKDLSARAHQTRHSFGTPSTPFAPHSSRPTAETLGKGVSIFGSSVRNPSIPRSASFRSIDADDQFQSPSSKIDSQSSGDSEVPPTPTRQIGISHVNTDGSFSALPSRQLNRVIIPLKDASVPESCDTNQGSCGSPLHNRKCALSPKTPREGIFPPDPSGLSICNHGEDLGYRFGKTPSSTGMFPPATPTAPKDYFASLNRSRNSAAPLLLTAATEVDTSLVTRFDKADLIGTGEFSQVYRVSRKQDLRAAANYFTLSSAKSSPRTPLPDLVWAVKRSRHAYHGMKDRQRKLQEVTALKALGQSEHTLEFVDSWEYQNHLYIQTEFCEEGSLALFLNQVGRKDRLDDFRIWKIMLELALGLKHVHDSGFIHLDLKPANILITFEGILKIADFGMATCWPAKEGIEGEGDREYIGPEILRGHFDKPADVFALGLIMLEIAANVVLPENGASWQRLRSGDMSDVPSLTWSSENSNVMRDSSGKPVEEHTTIEDFYNSDSSDDDYDASAISTARPSCGDVTTITNLRSGELAQPPPFMIDQNNSEALDNLVRWMISPDAADRPTAAQILSTTGVQWTDSRRRSGATIFEGNWGPADELLADDAEMIDV